MIRTHKRFSVAAAATVAAVAAGLALSVSLVSPSARAYALEETLRANKHVTIYHVKITPVAELGEAWVQLNPDGTPLQARMDFQSPEDGAKVVILSKGKAEVWFKDKNNLLFVPEADALKRISEMRNLADPKLAFERLQAAKAAGKVQIATKQPARDGQPIVLTVTSKAKPDQRQVYEERNLRGSPRSEAEARFWTDQVPPHHRDRQACVGAEPVDEGTPGARQGGD